MQLLDELVHNFIMKWGIKMDLRYPIGHFEIPKIVAENQRLLWLEDIESLPRRLNQIAKGLTEKQLSSTYREGGWTVRQIIHHLADSHLNSYMRMKLAVTENIPVIKTYDEEQWAEQADYTMSVDVSLQLIAGLHARWIYFLRHLNEAQYHRKFQYPDGQIIQLDQAIGLYAWHGNHHLRHIEIAIN